MCNHPVTLKQAKAELKAVNVTINLKSDWNEYRVNFRDGTEATAYYTDCLDDAYHTGIAMAEHKAKYGN